MNDWDDVCAFCLSLPGVTMESHYGAMVPKVGGKAFAAPGREPGSFAMMCHRDEKAVLMATDPATYWETPHYAGYPAVLVRFGRPDRARVEAYLRRAWWDRAPRELRRAFGDRP